MDSTKLKEETYTYTLQPVFQMPAPLPEHVPSPSHQHYSSQCSTTPSHCRSSGANTQERQEYKAQKRAIKAQNKIFKCESKQVTKEAKRCAKEAKRYAKDAKHEVKCRSKEFKHEVKCRSKELQKEIKSQAENALKTADASLRAASLNYSESQSRGSGHGQHCHQQSHCSPLPIRLLTSIVQRGLRGLSMAESGSTAPNSTPRYLAPAQAHAQVQVQGRGQGQGQAQAQQIPTQQAQAQPAAQSQPYQDIKAIPSQEPLLIYSMSGLTLHSPATMPSAPLLMATPRPDLESADEINQDIPPPSYEASTIRRTA